MEDKIIKLPRGKNPDIRKKPYKWIVPKKIGKYYKVSLYNFDEEKIKDYQVNELDYVTPYLSEAEEVRDMLNKELCGEASKKLREKLDSIFLS